MKRTDAQPWNDDNRERVAADYCQFSKQLICFLRMKEQFASEKEGNAPVAHFL